MNKIIVFIGPNYVGKTYLTKALARRLDVNYASSNNSFLNKEYSASSATNDIDNLRTYVIDNDVKIIDFNTNIENFDDDDLAYLKNSFLKNDITLVFVYLQPFENKVLSYYALSRFANPQNDAQRAKILNSLNSGVYEDLADIKIYTSTVSNNKEVKTKRFKEAYRLDMLINKKPETKIKLNQNQILYTQCLSLIANHISNKLKNEETNLKTR